MRFLLACLLGVCVVLADMEDITQLANQVQVSKQKLLRMGERLPYAGARKHALTCTYASFCK